MRQFQVGQEVRVIAHRSPRFVGQRAGVVIARPEEGVYFVGVEDCGAMGVEVTADQIEEIGQ